jgi:hypothetical protein
MAVVSAAAASPVVAPTVSIAAGVSPRPVSV